MTTSRFILGGLLVLFGIAILAGASVFKILFAVLLIFLGARVIFGFSHRDRQHETPVSASDSLNEVAILSPFDKTITSQAFRGGKVVLVFAGGELDLSEANIAVTEATLEVVAIFSGLKIIAPKHWRVRTDGTAIIGGYDNRATTPEGENQSTLIITGVVVCGGVDIVQ